MLERTEWMCPGCGRTYAVPWTEGLTVCPTCTEAMAESTSVVHEMTDIESANDVTGEIGTTTGFPVFDKPASQPMRRQSNGVIGAIFLLGSWILGMYLAWSVYRLLGQPQFIFRDDGVRWNLEIHRDRKPPVILPLR